MVSQTPDAPQGEQESNSWTSQSAAEWHRANRGGLRRMVASTVRLADLQIKIWLTHAKITVARLVLFIILYSIAGALGILATVFLFTGLFHILTDVIGLREVWALLIFAVFMFAVAGLMVVVAQKALAKQPGVADKKKPSREKTH